MSETKLYRDRNIQIVFGVTLMSVLGVSSISPVFPTIIRELGISPREIGLLITFFTLPGVFLAPVVGVLADRLGRKRILGPSLFLFALAGVACAFVRDFNLLLLLRVFQGIGAAALGSLSNTIIGDIYTGKRRAEAIGLNASILNIGTASYPTIGGALALLGWHYPFLLPIVALPIGIMVLTTLKSPEPQGYQGLKKYLSSSWNYLRNIRVLGLFAASIITFILLYGTILTYFTLLLAESFNASPFIIGLMFSGVSLTAAVISSQLGTINKKMSLGTIIRLSFVVYGSALILMPLMPSLWLLLVPVVIFGVAHGLNIPGVYTALAGAAPQEHRAAFMSLNVTVLRLGQTLGPPLMALIYVGLGFKATFFASGAIAFLTAVIAFLYVWKSRSSLA
ncbi:MFS transporter [Chloroflexota bacterium]